MGRIDNPAAVSTTAAACTTNLLKREDCKRTKHDSAFSQWKILIGASDWEDHLLNKEGAERYRIHNLPNCSSCSGLYELGITLSLPESGRERSRKLSSKRIIPVYLGQADNVRTRLQQYGRDGAHLENGCSNGEPSNSKGLGLFSDVFAKGFSIVYRWAPMQSKKDAEKTESQLLRTFDYAWNRGMNGERRPSDIHQKLNQAASRTRRLPPVFKKLHIFRPKEVGLRIKHCEPPVLENGSNFYTKQVGNGIMSRIFKFSGSRPVLVSKEFDINDSDVRICGVALGQGSICTRPPVEGRRRCADHKGMKVNAFVRPRLLGGEEVIHPLTCAADLENGKFCTNQPVIRRKRCERHKGMRVNRNKIRSTFADSVSDTRISIDQDSNKNTVESESSSACGAITLDGSFCRRKPGKGRKVCWQHEAKRVNVSPHLVN